MVGVSGNCGGDQLINWPEILQMTSIVRIRKEPDDIPEPEESRDHEWAEYNLPAYLLMGLATDEEDRLAFLGLGTEMTDSDPPENAG